MRKKDRGSTGGPELRSQEQAAGGPGEEWTAGDQPASERWPVHSTPRTINVTRLDSSWSFSPNLTNVSSTFQG